MRIIVKDRFAKVFTQNYVRRLSRLMRVRYGWRCVYDEMSEDVSNIIKNSNNVELVNRFNLLQDEVNGEHGANGEFEKTFEIVNVNPTHTVVSCNKKLLNIKQRGLRIGTWKIRAYVAIGKHLK